MHKLILHTAYTFGDYVIFDSKTQDRKGKGRIVAVTVDELMAATYTLEVDGADLETVYQAGILEGEITKKLS